MKRADTCLLRQEDIGKTEGEGVQEHGETGAVVRHRDVGNKIDWHETVGENQNEDALVDKSRFIEKRSRKERKDKSRARCPTDQRQGERGRITMQWFGHVKGSDSYFKMLMKWKW